MTRKMSNQVLNAICAIKILEVIRHSCGHTVFFDDYDSLLKAKNVYVMQDIYLDFLNDHQAEDKNLSPVTGGELKLESKLAYCNMLADRLSRVAVFVDLTTGKISVRSFNKNRLLNPKDDRDALLILFSTIKQNPNWAVAANIITHHLDSLMVSKKIPGVRSWDSLGMKRPNMKGITPDSERLHCRA